MLSPQCEHFRDRFREGIVAIDESHRDICQLCAAWADRLETALRPSTPTAMPEGLQQRLQAIAACPSGCDSVDRFYAETGRLLTTEDSQEAGDNDNHGLLQSSGHHLQSCERCQKVYGLLASAQSTGDRPLPSTLRSKLLRRSEPVQALPPWIRDVRYTAAACYSLTFFLLFLAGDASARFRDTVDRVGYQASFWIREGEEQGRSTWEEVQTWTDQNLEEGRLRVAPWREQAESSWHKTTQKIGEIRPDLLRSRLRPKRGEKNERDTESVD